MGSKTLVYAASGNLVTEPDATQGPNRRCSKATSLDLPTCLPGPSKLFDVPKVFLKNLPQSLKLQFDGPSPWALLRDSGGSFSSAPQQLNAAPLRPVLADWRGVGWGLPKAKPVAMTTPINFRMNISESQILREADTQTNKQTN